MRIEVIYSPAPRVVDRVELELDDGSTVDAALRASGLLERHAGLVDASPTVGVWGRVVPRNAVLRDGDRVELYRPLQVDPMEGRRRRLAHQARTGGRTRR